MKTQLEETWSEMGVEPTLEEVLSDQLFHLVQGRDGLCAQETRRFLMSMASRLKHKWLSGGAARAQ